MTQKIQSSVESVPLGLWEKSMTTQRKWEKTRLPLDSDRDHHVPEVKFEPGEAERNTVWPFITP